MVGPAAVDPDRSGVLAVAGAQAGQRGGQVVRREGVGRRGHVDRRPRTRWSTPRRGPEDGRGGRGVRSGRARSRAVVSTGRRSPGAVQLDPQRQAGRRVGPEVDVADRASPASRGISRSPARVDAGDPAGRQPGQLVVAGTLQQSSGRASAAAGRRRRAAGSSRRARWSRSRTRRPSGSGTALPEQVGLAGAADPVDPPVLGPRHQTRRSLSSPSSWARLANESLSGSCSAPRLWRPGRTSRPGRTPGSAGPAVRRARAPRAGRRARCRTASGTPTSAAAASSTTSQRLLTSVNVGRRAETLR